MSRYRYPRNIKKIVILYDLRKKGLSWRAIEKEIGGNNRVHSHIYKMFLKRYDVNIILDWKERKGWKNEENSYTSPNSR